MQSQQKIYDLDIARQKIEAFCAYQERSHKQVKEKLLSYGLKPEIADEILIELIQNNFLNEQRFAEIFTSGKFRIKKWGRQKIKKYLKAHQVSEYNVKKALETIEEKEYQKTFLDTADKKWSILISENKSNKKQKLQAYLYNKGFESELIYDYLRDL